MTNTDFQTLALSLIDSGIQQKKTLMFNIHWRKRILLLLATHQSEYDAMNQLIADLGDKAVLILDLFKLEIEMTKCLMNHAVLIMRNKEISQLTEHLNMNGENDE